MIWCVHLDCNIVTTICSCVRECGFLFQCFWCVRVRFLYLCKLEQLLPNRSDVRTLWKSSPQECVCSDQEIVATHRWLLWTIFEHDLPCHLWSKIVSQPTDSNTWSEVSRCSIHRPQPKTWSSHVQQLETWRIWLDTCSTYRTESHRSRHAVLSQCSIDYKIVERVPVCVCVCSSLYKIL
jgi:hypothetical protein